MIFFLFYSEWEHLMNKHYLKNLEYRNCNWWLCFPRTSRLHEMIPPWFSSEYAFCRIYNSYSMGEWQIAPHCVVTSMVIAFVSNAPECNLFCCILVITIWEYEITQLLAVDAISDGELFFSSCLQTRVLVADDKKIEQQCKWYDITLSAILI